MRNLIIRDGMFSDPLRYYSEEGNHEMISPKKLFDYYEYDIDEVCTVMRACRAELEDELIQMHTDAWNQGPESTVVILYRILSTARYMFADKLSASCCDCIETIRSRTNYEKMPYLTYERVVNLVKRELEIIIRATIDAWEAILTGQIRPSARRNMSNIDGFPAAAAM